MSVKAMAEVWERAPDHWDASTLILALALADHVGADHVAWPSRRALIRRTRLSESSVRRAARTLELEGWIARETRFADGGRQTSNLWIWRGEGVMVTPL